MQAGSFPAPGASLHLDFVGNRGFSAGRTGTAASFLTFTNASSQYYTDASGNLALASANSAVFDYSRSSVGTILGLRVQKQRTNSIRNNTMVGAAAGSPGTLPTNWNRTGSITGLTQTIGLPGTINGVNEMTVRLNGTTAASSITYYTDTTTGITASAGQVWTASAFLHLAAGSTTNLTAFQIGLVALDSSQVQIGTNSTIGVLAANLQSSPTRYEVSRTLPANTAYVRLFVAATYTNGAAIDFTMGIGLPQLEQGQGATSPIATTNAAATRSGDVVALTDFASIFNQWGGTVVSEWVYGTDTSTAGVWIVSDGTASNAIRGALYNGAGANVSDVLVSGSSPGGVSVATQNTAATTYRHAVEYDRTILAASGSGAAQDQILTPSMPASLSAMYLGCGSGNGAVTNNLDGWLRQLIYFPRAARPYQLPGLSR